MEILCGYIRKIEKRKMCKINYNKMISKRKKESDQLKNEMSI